MHVIAADSSRAAHSSIVMRMIARRQMAYRRELDSRASNKRLWYSKMSPHGMAFLSYILNTTMIGEQRSPVAYFSCWFLASSRAGFLFRRRPRRRSESPSRVINTNDLWYTRHFSSSDNCRLAAPARITLLGSFRQAGRPRVLGARHRSRR